MSELEAGTMTARHAPVVAVEIAIDDENTSRVWWDAAIHEAYAPALDYEAAEIVTQLVHPWEFEDAWGVPEIPMDPPDCRRATVRPELAERIREWAESLPGWRVGPSYAPHPLRFLEIS